MRHRPSRCAPPLAVLPLLALLAPGLLGGAAPAAGPGGQAGASSATVVPAPAHRIVSMNPSLTRILVALGARDALVGVDDFSARAEPGVARLPRVGGLYAPSLEAVVALRPDLVVLVPSVEQREFRARLEGLRIPVLALDPVTFDDVLDTIVRLGRRVGREAAARERIDAIRRTRDAVERAVADLPHPRTVFVLQREPLFVVGRGSFLDDMLGYAGARNLGAELGERWPRASLEWLVAAAPGVILDSDSDPAPAAAFWTRWPSLPAVAGHRVVPLRAGEVTLPGPDLDHALVTLARALHGPALHLEGAP
jgi:iron complex transport system substrate-binding protein